MRRIVLIATCLALLAFAQTSQATPLPDNAAVDQYTEGVPTAKGQKSEDGVGALPPGAAAPLDALGQKGAAAAAVAKVTAPAPGDTAESQSSGMGIWLLLILLACLLAAATWVYARRRASQAA